MTPEQITVSVGKLHFDALAAGPPDGPLVVLLHGFPQSSWEWRLQLPALAEAGFRAVAPDQRGYSPGARPKGIGQYRLNRLAEDAVGMAKALGARHFHLVGHDWGAAVGWVAAALYPERLASLCAVSMPHPFAFAEALASPSGDQASRSGYMRFFQQPDVPERVLLADEGGGLRAVFANSDYRDRRTMERYVERLRDPETLTAALNWYRAIDAEALFGVGPSPLPTLYVWGTEDAAQGPEGADACGRYVTGPYRYERLEGASHWIPEESAERFNALLLEHLEKTTAA